MAGLSKMALGFLKDLKAHNERDWFNANKDRFLAAQTEFTELCAELLKGMAKFDKGVVGVDPRKCVFRIYRDTRFAKDKAPFKTNFGALLGNKGHMGSRAGYYLHVEPGASFVGGGVYMVDGKIMTAVRQHISANAAAFRKILATQGFEQTFRFEGDKLSKVPQGFAKDDPMAEYLKYKNFAVVHDLSDKLLMQADATDQILALYKAMKPFNTFIDKPLRLAGDLPVLE